MRKPLQPPQHVRISKRRLKNKKSPQLRYQPRLPGNAKFTGEVTVLFSVSVIVKQLERKGCVFFAYALKGVHLKTD